MGLAASQARFLQLTARKSNIEYQGQQLNQARTALADQSAQLFNKMLDIKPAVAPSSSESAYTKPTYTFSDATNPSIDKTIKDWSPATDSNGTVMPDYYNFTITYQDQNGVQQTNKYTNIYVKFDENGSMDEVRIPNDSYKGYDPTTGTYADSTTYKNDESGTALKYGSEYDSKAYDSAMNQYEYDKAQYNKELVEINAKTQDLQQQDKALELQLRQVDTQQRAVQTELESVQKVLDKNIELTFKTFA